MTADIASLQIRIDSQQAQNATGDLERMRDAGSGAEQSTGALESASKKLGSALAALGIGAAMAEVIKLSDAYDGMTARLKIATNSTAQFLSVQQALIVLSEKQRVSLEASTDLYAKASAATSDMGVSQKDLLKFTEGVSAALTLNGASAESAAGALNQLGQALGGGKIQAEEFNSILDGARPLLQAVANNMGAAGGSVASLTQLVKAGKVESADFFAAAVKGSDELVASAAQIPLTFSQAIGIAKDRLMVFVGGMNESTGVVTALSNSVVAASETLVFFAKNLDVVVSVVATLAAARGASWVAGLTKELAAGIATSRAAAAATLQTAQANAAATASSVALTTARVAELRIAVIAAEGQVALAITTNGLIPAQARAALAAEAHAASLIALSAAQRGASITAGILSTALKFVGGPIGAVITILGIAATAWHFMGSSSVDSVEKSSDAVRESTDEILTNLDKQIVKLNERNELAERKIVTTKVESPASIRLGEVIAELDRVGRAEGEYAKLNLVARQSILMALGGEYGRLTEKIEAFNAATAKDAASKNSKTTADWMIEYATGAEKLKAKLQEVAQSYKDGVIPIELEKRIRESFADRDAGAKSAAAATEKEAEAYASLSVAISQKIAESSREAAGLKDINEAQKLRISLDEQIAGGTLKLTDAHKAAYEQQILTLAASLDVIESNKRAKEGADALAKIESTYAEQAKQRLTAATDEAAKNEELAATFGMSASAIKALELARLEDQLAQRSSIGMTLEEISALEKMIDAKRRSMAAVVMLGSLEADKAANAARLEDSKKMWESIDTTAHDTFVSIFDSGKSAFDRLRDTLKNGLLDMLYQMTIKKWILNIGASVSGTGAAGLASAEGLGLTGGAAGGGLGGVASLAQSAKTAYTIATQGFSGVAVGIGGSIATLGNLFGSSAVSAFGAGMGMTGAQAAAASAAYGSAGMAGTGTALTSGAFAGAAVTAAAGIAAGVLGGKLISGQYGSNATVIGGTGIGAVAGAFMGGPIGAAIGGALGGLIGGLGNRIFGMGDKKYGETGITGTLSGTGFSGTEYAKWTQKGGWLRSDKADTDRKAVDATTSNAFVETYAAIRNVSATLAYTLGVDTSSLSARAQALNINLTGLTTEADRLGAVTKFFEGVGNAIALELVPSLGQFKVGNEELSTTLQRVSQDYVGVDAVLQLIGRTSQDAFGAVGVATIGARENLIKLAGSLDSLSSGTSFFAQNFLTEAEQMAPVLSTVADTLAALGMAGTTTMDDYKKKVLGLNLATEAGQERYIKMLALAPAFKAASDYTNQLAAATGNYTAVVKTASEIASERMDLQKQLNELTMSEGQLLTIQRASIAEVNRALFDQVQAEKAAAAARDAAAKSLVTAKDALTSAYQAESSAAQSALDKVKNWVSSLNSMNAGLALGNLSTLTPEQKYAEARAQFEKTLAAARGGDTEAQSGLSAAEQAFLTASQLVNASSTKYAADYALVQAANAEALKYAAAQVNMQQASLDALKAQVSGLITLNTSMLTVAQAIAELRAAMGVATRLGVPFDGSHAGGLTNVPFNGYAAELHQGEVVVDAAAAAAMRRYFGGAPSQGGGNTDALVAEIRALREENKATREELRGLRADQAKQTGDIILGNYDASDKAANKQVAGAKSAAMAPIYAEKMKGKLA